MDRRSFLRLGAAVAAPLVVPSSVLGRGGAVAHMTRVTQTIS